MRTRLDVLVVGGGPAGSAAARRAALGGARTILIEQKRLPRPKLCGGWVSRRALEQLGFPIPTRVIEHDFNCASIRYGAAGTGYKPDCPLGIFVDRAVFDACLVEKALEAGAELRHARARSISQTNGAYELDTTAGVFIADSIVICTGANAALTGLCRPTDRTDWSAVCLEQRLSSDWAGHLGVQAGEAQLTFSVVGFGYGWVLHHGEYLIVGIGARRSPTLLIREEFDRFWKSLSLPENLKAPQGHKIPLGGFPRKLGNGRVLCAGDAAGMVDAFSGEGIATAIESGQLAAEAILTAGNAEAANVYGRFCRKALLPEMSESLRAARLFHSAPKALVRAFCREPANVAEFDLVMRRQSSYTRLLRHAAWRLITGARQRRKHPVNTCNDAQDRATGQPTHAL